MTGAIQQGPGWARRSGGLDLGQLGARAEETRDYSFEDVAHYALAVGAMADEATYLDESQGGAVLPTFANILAFPLIYKLHVAVGCDPLGVLHLEQKIESHRPFAPSARVRTSGVLDGIYDHGLMASTHVTTETHDQHENLICRTEWTVAHVRNGGFGGPPPPRRKRIRPPERSPDFVFEQTTSPTQALHYALLGDRNPIHTSQDFARRAGFPAPLMHGLCTYGFVCRAVLRCCDVSPAALEQIACEFRKPMYPGETIVTSGWREGALVVLAATTKERPHEPMLQNAYVRLRSPG